MENRLFYLIVLNQGVIWSILRWYKTYQIFQKIPRPIKYCLNEKLVLHLISYINSIVFHTLKYHFLLCSTKKIKICLKNALSTSQINDETSHLFSFLAHFVNFLVRGPKNKRCCKFLFGTKFTNGLYGRRYLRKLRDLPPLLSYCFIEINKDVVKKFSSWSNPVH